MMKSIWNKLPFVRDHSSGKVTSQEEGIKSSGSFEITVRQKEIEVDEERLNEVKGLFFQSETWDPNTVNKWLKDLTPEDSLDFQFCAKFFKGMWDRLEGLERDQLDRLFESGYSTEKDSITDLILLQNAYRAAKENNFIDPKKRKKELAEKDQLEPSEQEELEKLRLESKIQKAKIYARFNLGVTAAKGATGTLLIKDEKKRLIGVFKPGTRYAGTSVRIKNWLKQKFFGQLYFLKSGPLAQPQAEVVSYKLDRFFGFNVVPPSALVDLGEKRGAFQVAAYKGHKEKEEGEETSEAKDLLHVLNNEKREFKEEELDLIQRYILHDFLIGNLDAHEENFFVKMVDGKITNVIGIDKANSFLRKHPWGFANRNQHKWGELNITKKPFTGQMKNLMSSLTEEEIKKFIQGIKRDPELKDFFDEEIEKRLQERARVLREFAEQKNPIPSELAKLRTKEDIERFLSQGNRVI